MGRGMAKPTDRQLDVLRFVAGHIAAHRYAPSIREICEGLGVSSGNGISQHLDYLEQKGLIGRTPKVSRGLWVTGAGEDAIREGKNG
jgi:repressor LexA